VHISPLPSRVQHTPAISNSFIWLGALSSPLRPRHTPLIKETMSVLQLPQALIMWTIQLIMTQCFKSRIFNIYLLKGHILISERFAGCRHVLRSKVCLLLLGIPTNISLPKRTYDSSFSFIYLFMGYLLSFIYPHKNIFDKECSNYAKSELFRFNKKFTYRKSKNISIILNTINWCVLLILQAQNMFLFSEIFGSVYYSVICPYQL